MLVQIPLWNSLTHARCSCRIGTPVPSSSRSCRVVHQVFNASARGRPRKGSTSAPQSKDPLHWPDSAVQLRDYQQEAIRAVEARHKDGSERLLVILPTGTGKTVIFAALCRYLQLKALVLVHTLELAEQTMAQFRRIWPEVDLGIVQGKRKELGRQITVATVQTARQKKVLPELEAHGVQLLLVDEAHHSIATTYVRIMKALGFVPETHKTNKYEAEKRVGKAKNEMLAVGFTATPYRRGATQTTKLLAMWESIAYVRNIEYMMERNFLATVRAIRVLSYADLDSVSISQQDFAQGELSELVNSTDRNLLVVNSYRQWADGRKAIAFCVDVQHSLDLAAVFNSRGIPAAVLHGAMQEEHRRQTLRDFATGKIRVLTNCMVLTEAFDEPTIGCVLMARPTRSLGLYVQCVGRGLRVAEGKENCIVLDFTDRYHDLNKLQTIKTAIAGTRYYNEPPERGPAKIEGTEGGGEFDILNPVAWEKITVSVPLTHWVDDYCSHVLDSFENLSEYTSEDESDTEEEEEFDTEYDSEEEELVVERGVDGQPGRTWRLSRLERVAIPVLALSIRGLGFLVVWPLLLDRYYDKVYAAFHVSQDGHTLLWHCVYGSQADAKFAAEWYLQNTLGSVVDVELFKASSRWRQTGATYKQIEFLRKLNVEQVERRVARGLTKGEAGRLITQALLRQKAIKILSMVVTKVQAE